MTTRPARRDGGTTKLVPCTTSSGPVNHSMGGADVRRQARCKGRAGIGHVKKCLDGQKSCADRPLALRKMRRESQRALLRLT